ncbi:MAG: hypothetical protein AB3N18_05525 [Allomuricauda sp.]
MKKTLSILAITVFTLGLFSSCEAETDVAETESLFETIDKDATLKANTGGSSNDDDRN